MHVNVVFKSPKSLQSVATTVAEQVFIGHMVRSCPLAHFDKFGLIKTNGVLATHAQASGCSSHRFDGDTAAICGVSANQDLLAATQIKNSFKTGAAEEPCDELGTRPRCTPPVAQCQLGIGSSPPRLG